MNWKEYGRKRQWRSLGAIPSSASKNKKTTKILSQYSRSVHLGPPEYEIGALKSHIGSHPKPY